MSEEAPIKGIEPLLNFIGRSLEEGETTKYSRSDILRPVVYPIAATVGILPLLVWAQAPELLVAGDALAAALLVLLYGAAYGYCFFKRPDSLRSERYELAKYAIQQQLFGDNRTGLIEASPARAAADKDPAESLAETSGTVK